MSVEWTVAVTVFALVGALWWSQRAHAPYRGHAGLKSARTHEGAARRGGSAALFHDENGSDSGTVD